MKKQYLPISFYLLLLINYGYAQQKTFTFGVTPISDVEMTTYEKDTTAGAVILYDHGKAKIRYESNGPILTFECVRRIKIFDRSAFDRANIAISLYKSTTSRDREKISDIKAYSFTKGENGTIEKTTLGKEAIFHEDYTENTDLVKFTVPNIKEGSVIDYSYTITSPFLYNFIPWSFQTDIPKLYSQYDTSIPGNFVYNTKFIGNLPIAHHNATVKKNCVTIPSIGSGSCSESTYIMKDVPAFQKEDYMLSEDNFISKLEFELGEYHSIRGGVEKYTKSWDDVDYELNYGEELGQQSKKTAYFKKALPADLYEIGDDLERAKAIYSHLKSYMFWDQSYDIFGDNDVKKSYEEASGSVAEVNLILLNALKAANLDAKTMLLATRDRELPTRLYPVLSEFNYLVVKLTIGDTYYLLDITDKDLDFGLLPFRCLNGSGRVFDFETGSYWQPIIPTHRTSYVVQNYMDLKDDGTITVKSRQIKNGYFAYNDRKKYAKNDKERHIAELEDRVSSLVDVEISRFDILNQDAHSKPFVKTIHYNIEQDISAGDQHFLYPFLLSERFDKNPFTLKNRTYQVDFGYDFKYEYHIHITLPENKVFKNIPQNKEIAGTGNRFSLKLDVTAKENVLDMLFVFSVNGSRFEPEQYTELKEFFEEVVFIQNDMPVQITEK
ncbi:hypothetical protein [Ascidiimonas aurantiaca]|uniref:hypothetical protein n=1 Tax=Ascidiimonas aurantiaca TaxID=1685432 RepID=UPI0030ED01EB